MIDEENPALTANTPAKAEFLVYSLEQVAESIGVYVNANSFMF